MLIFGATANCVPWVYVPEILPLHVRAKGTAVGISSNWLWNFVIVMITPVILNRLKWAAYLIFVGTNLAFIPLVYYCFPETTNLTLEEIDYLFLNASEDTAPLGGMSRLLRPQEPVLLSFDYLKLKAAGEVDAVERATAVARETAGIGEKGEPGKQSAEHKENWSESATP